MTHDSITEEIREIRHQLAAKFDNDIDRIGEDLRRRQAESGRKYITLPKRPPRLPTATSHAPSTSGPTMSSTSGQSLPAAG